MGIIYYFGRNLEINMYLFYRLNDFKPEKDVAGQSCVLA